MGTLAGGIVNANPTHSFLTRLIGGLAYGVFYLAGAFAIFFDIKTTPGLRVDKEEKRLEIDVSQHGLEADGGLQVTHNQTAKC
ncbi:MAG: hypothetical protein VYE68_11470 [Acidobacteriota bacterium]|nr:hypothetical protein [Acidobacteriota bacterium]